METTTMTDAGTTDATEASDGITVDGHAFDIAKHDGTITVHNPATGNHRTFRVKTVRRGNLKGKRVLSLLTGPDNGSDYQGFAFVEEDFGDALDPTINVWRKYRGQAGPDGYHETEWEKFARLLRMSGYYSQPEHGGLQYLAALSCRRCGRKLTVPESVKTGIGPVCAGKM